MFETFSAFSINVHVAIHQNGSKQADPETRILKSGDLDQNTLESHQEHLMSAASMNESLLEVKLILLFK
jgi:hypothetical protein